MAASAGQRLPPRRLQSIAQVLGETFTTQVLISQCTFPDSFVYSVEIDEGTGVVGKDPLSGKLRREGEPPTSSPPPGANGILWRE